MSFMFFYDKIINMYKKSIAGKPYPFGATVYENGINFAVFSDKAEHVYLELYKKAENSEPYQTISLSPETNKTGSVWHVFIEDLKAPALYLYRIEGEYAPEKGLRFDKDAHLFDPYAKAFTEGSVFKAFNAARKNGTNVNTGAAEMPKICNKAEMSLFPKCIAIDESFDWEDDKALCIPLRNSVIYELHVKGFTASPSSNVKKGGTYSGLAEKIPYLKSLGITAVELLPVFEFDENENERKNPQTGETLKNFWGYSTIGFFAPKQSYSCGGNRGEAVKEFKTLVKKMHKAGIEVILDVVFNHTAEGNHFGNTFSFRGFENDVYYILSDKDRRYYNDYSGCGNSLNCNHPVVAQFILDCLHYWVLQMHVDGFRFDLASVLCRSESGEMLPNPYLTRAISEDPVLKSTKIIAEPWDAVGAYQAGSFPGGRWCSWNDKFRDGMRRFFRGEDNVITEMATRLAGSSDIYAKAGPEASINYICVHDGFTLKDLVSYTTKHNEANGEGNRDGTENNYSYDNGVEGETDDKKINAQRLKTVKNLLFSLFISQGVPLLLAGDEFGRTQKGNNNAYCQDNEISWVDWNLAKENSGLIRFVQKLIELRKDHNVFRRKDFFKGLDGCSFSMPDIVWYNSEGQNPDWSKLKRFIACRFYGAGAAAENGRQDNDFYLAVNMDNLDRVALLPPLPSDRSWRRVADTSVASPEDIFDPGNEEILPSQKRYIVPAGSIVLLLSMDILQNRRMQI